MIIVEISTKTIRTELEKLSNADGPASVLYARGAADALNWILNGEPPPSEGGMEPKFPVILNHENVH